MREMEFKMERPGLLKEGETLPVTEYRVSTFYYYMLGKSYAMSANYTVTERLKSREGVVASIEETPRGYYVKMRFDEDPV